MIGRLPYEQAYGWGHSVSETSFLVNIKNDTHFLKLIKLNKIKFTLFLNF